MASSAASVNDAAAAGVPTSQPPAAEVARHTTPKAFATGRRGAADARIPPSDRNPPWTGGSTRQGSLTRLAAPLPPPPAQHSRRTPDFNGTPRPVAAAVSARRQTLRRSEAAHDSTGQRGGGGVRTAASAQRALSKRGRVRGRARQEGKPAAKAQIKKGTPRIAPGENGEDTADEH